MKSNRDHIAWLDPIELRFDSALETSKKLLKSLTAQLRKGLKDQGYEPNEVNRCVYVIRMKGDFLIGYPAKRSPVLYIGRGAAFGRLASHLKNWLSEVHQFGRDVAVEVRVCRPRKRNCPDLFKCVEADLIELFRHDHGSLPFFNGRREHRYRGETSYGVTEEKMLNRAIGVGSGNRPRWILTPAPANKNYEIYMTGHA